MSETTYKKVSVSENDNEKNRDSQKYGCGIRHVQGVLFFLSITIGYMARGHLGVSIVAMTDAKSTGMNRTMNISYNATVDLKEYEMDIQDDQWNIYRTYNWSKSTQEMVLGSFFLGYCVMMFPGGIICQKFGGILPLQIGLLVNAVVSVLTPWIVVWGGWKALCACRVLQGLTQAGLHPAVQTLMSNWVPVSERGSFSGYIYTGSGVGTVLAFQLGGILAYSRFGWPSMYWLVGVACFVIFLLVTFLGAPCPDAHQRLSVEEKKYIIGDIQSSVQTNPVTPWKSILTCVPLWSTLIAHIGTAVAFIFSYIQLPTYMNAVMKLNIRNNGLLSSLPYIAYIFTSIIFGYISDFLTNKKLLSMKNSRKLSNTVATVIPAICLASVCYTKNTFLAVVCFIISQGSMAAMHTGWMINYIDLSPNYIGVLMAFGGTLTNILVLTLPVLVSNIVVDVTNQQQWRIMMFIISSFIVFSNIIFIIFMSAEVQPWNDSETEKKSDSEEVKLEIIKESLKESLKGSI